MGTLLLAEILDEAQDLLVKTFNRNELKQLLLSKMNVSLDDIAPNATGNKDLVFEVLTWMDRRGNVNAFIQVAAANRPNIPEWQALVTKLSAAPRGTTALGPRTDYPQPAIGPSPGYHRQAIGQRITDPRPLTLWRAQP